MNRTLRRILRFSLITTVPLVAYWCWFYLANGYIPSTDTAYVLVGVPDMALMKLHVPVSRGWDLLIGPVWMAILIPLFQAINVEPGGDLASGWDYVTLLIWLGVLVGFFDGLVLGIPSGIASSLILGTVFGLFVLVVWGICLLFSWAGH